VFADDNEHKQEKENEWLQEHKKQFGHLDDCPGPLFSHLGQQRQCRSCGRMAPRRTIKAGKCLACQVTDYLDHTL